MPEELQFTIFIDYLWGYEFNVRFDWENVPDLLLDEPLPLGEQKGPNASRLLAAAVGNCLSASLLFCLQKAKVEMQGLKTMVTGSLTRNERGRLRVERFDVRIQLEGTEQKAGRLGRCIDLFEDYCVVTASIRDGVPVHVEVVTESGERVYGKQVS